MSQIVSKQSLDALANLAFKSKFKAAGNSRAKAHFNLEGSSGTAFYCFILGDPSNHKETSDEARDFVSSYTSGMEFGLAVAAAILTHQHDVPALCKALKSELREAARDWPHKLAKIAEAA